MVDAQALIEIEGNRDLVRDRYSKGLMSVDRQGLEASKIRRNAATKNKDLESSVRALERKVSGLETSVDALLELVREIATRQKNNG